MSRKLNAYNMHKKCLTLPIICDIMALPLKGSFFFAKEPVGSKAAVWCFPSAYAGGTAFYPTEGGVYFYGVGYTAFSGKSKKYFRKAGGAVMRFKITLACTECKQRNYNTMKNKKNDPDRLEMNKYCRFCKKHTLHKETK